MHLSWQLQMLEEPECLQVIGEWVAERNLEEVLHIMGEARVPSGILTKAQGALAGGELCLFARKPFLSPVLLLNPIAADMKRLAWPSALCDIQNAAASQDFLVQVQY